MEGGLEAEAEAEARQECLFQESPQNTILEGCLAMMNFPCAHMCIVENSFSSTSLRKQQVTL